MYQQDDKYSTASFLIVVRGRLKKNNSVQIISKTDGCIKQSLSSRKTDMSCANAEATPRKKHCTTHRIIKCRGGTSDSVCCGRGVSHTAEVFDLFCINPSRWASEYLCNTLASKLQYVNHALSSQEPYVMIVERSFFDRVRGVL